MKAFGSAGLVVVMAMAACARAPERTAAATGPVAAAAPAVTDAEIAAIVVAANAVDAEMGELASARATDAAVREFGRTMTRDHRAVNEQAGALVTKLGVTPAENDVSRKLRADATVFRAELEKKSGADFDRAYMAHEVAYQRAVIAAVDDVLIPSARNAELKQTLVAVRPALVAHLEHAEQLERKLK